MAEEDGEAAAALLQSAHRPSTDSVSVSGAMAQANRWLLPRSLDPHGYINGQLMSMLSSQFGVELEGELPEEVIAHLQKLRAPILLSTLLWVSALALQVVCMIDGWMVLFTMKSIPKGCMLLWYWVLGYSTAVTSLAICVVPAELAVVFCTVFAQVAKMVSSDCSEQLCGFADLVFMIGMPSVACVVAAAGLARCFLPKLQQLQECWCNEGPAPAEVVACIQATGSAKAGPAGAECVVCMVEADAGASWIALKCGHGFHEECLREWLARSSRCPLCRVDLRTAYLSA